MNASFERSTGRKSAFTDCISLALVSNTLSLLDHLFDGAFFSKLDGMEGASERIITGAPVN